MEHSKLLVTFLCLISLISCIDQSDSIEPTDEDHLSEVEKLLTRNWQYEYIEVLGDKYHLTHQYSIEPIEYKKFVREEIHRRRIKYTNDRNYIVNWTDQGEYELGWAHSDNWQPNEGYWQLRDSETILFHNFNQSYEVSYRIIQLTENSFIRKSWRSMPLGSETDIWLPDEVVEFTEAFIPVSD